MNKQEIIKLQNKILDMVPNRSGIYLVDCCSEISRLIIGWLFAYDNNYEFYILKGDNVLSSDKSHDILVVKKGSEISIIDPTIWQFFPKAKTILVYGGNDIKSGIDKIKRKYKGNWNLGKQESIPDSDTQKMYINIIKSNIIENVKEISIE